MVTPVTSKPLTSKSVSCIRGKCVTANTTTPFDVEFGTNSRLKGTIHICVVVSENNSCDKKKENSGEKHFSNKFSGMNHVDVAAIDAWEEQ